MPHRWELREFSLLEVTLIVGCVFLVILILLLLVQLA
jgi:hypothetical protein